MKYDALLLLSYGSPERHADIVPFLENLFRGSMPPAQTIDRIVEQYRELARRYGYFSPLGDQCREFLLHFLRTCSSGELCAGNAGGKNGGDEAEDFSVYWGNLFWHPFLEDTLREMLDDGVRNVLAFVTSPLDSCYSRGRYVEEIGRIAKTLDDRALRIDFFPPFATNPHYIRAVADRLLEAAAHLQLEFDYSFESAGTKILFTAHSLPLSDSGHEFYETTLRQAAGDVVSLIRECETRHEFRVAESCAVGFLPWETVYQSRGSLSREKWLGPDILERIRELSKKSRIGNQPLSLIVVPLGFLLENKETVYDLDVRTMELCEELRIPAIRSATAGVSPTILRMIFEKLRET